MPNYTSNYSLPKPLVNDATDEDLWGGYINDGADLIDTQMKTNADATTLAVMGNLLYPVGTIYTNKSVSTNPGTLLGFGTWVAITDKFIVARGSTYTGTGGAATVALAVTNLPAHTHSMQGDQGSDSISDFAVNAGSNNGNTINTSSTGSGTAFSIIPPYQAVYVWERTV